MNANPFAFLDEIQMAFSDASNHAQAAIADVDRYVMPPGTITFIRNDGTSTEPMQVGPVLVEVVTDIRSGQESAGPSERQA